MRMIDFEGRPNINAAHAGPLTVGAAAGLLSALVTLHNTTRFVIIRLESAALRLTVNGTTPTNGALGFKYSVLETEILLSRGEADSCRLIREGGTDATIQVAQFTH